MCGRSRAETEVLYKPQNKKKQNKKMEIHTRTYSQMSQLRLSSQFITGFHGTNRLRQPPLFLALYFSTTY